MYPQPKIMTASTFKQRERSLPAPLWHFALWVVLTAFVYFKTKPNNKAGDAR